MSVFCTRPIEKDQIVVSIPRDITLAGEAPDEWKPYLSAIESSDVLLATRYVRFYIPRQRSARVDLETVVRTKLGSSIAIKSFHK